MLYVPNNYLNSAYYYRINNNSLVVYTNNNCYSQYSNTYCDCYDIYYNNDYVITNSYTCNRTNISSNINYNYLTSNWVYRNDVDKIFLITFIIFCFILFFVYLPVSRLFGRWLKV